MGIESKPRSGLGMAVVAPLLAVLVTSCGIDPYTLGNDGDGGQSDGGGLDGTSADGGGQLADARLPDATPPPDACIPFPETCDGFDNDCDGEIDEDFHFESDPRHCGGCGQACSQPNMAGTCALSTCSYECLPGFVDLDPLVDGCEYACQPTNGGNEVCDFADNDCDGEIDEDSNLDTDEANCGGCGRVCLVLHAAPLCEAGICSYAVCDDGYADLVAGVPGCDYQCPEWPTTVETCDGIDNDCNGLVDDGTISGLGGACTDPGFETIADTGECAFGALTCSFGTQVCTGYVKPAQEICNDLDDDCDGVPDNGFDKLNDPRYCGGCTACSLTDAIAGCSAGVCTVVACESGFVDQDGDPANGCEYQCTPTGPEVCDGLDNDCDRLFDLDDPDLTAPSNFCTQTNACAGATPICAAPTCGGTTRWRCDWGPDVEVDTCGNRLLQETLCDEIDGDCDGFVDEVFSTKGTPCADDNDGICQGTGVFVCKGSHDEVECNITTPGQVARPEECNNIDDDCDGTVDNDAPAEMVLVDNGLLRFNIFAFEASRPDATDSVHGAANHRACSTGGVLPWRNATWSDANDACTASGLRLCTESEWQLACQGASGTIYPYGNAYDPNACNGREYDPDCTAPNDDISLPTGTAYGCPAPLITSCISDYGVADMSGNLMEWTATQVTALPQTYRVRGGSYATIEQGLTCDLSFIAYPTGFYFNDLGFRCCADAP